MHLNILPKLRLIFCCHQQKIQKKSLITRQTKPFFSNYSSGFIRWYISFLDSQAFKIQLMESPYALFSGLYNTNLNAKNDTLALTQISSFQIKAAKCWYITCFVPNFIPIWPRTHDQPLLIVKVVNWGIHFSN